MSNQRISPRTGDLGDRKERFDESVTIVPPLTDDGEYEEPFSCDEEPNVLSAKAGYGYNPLALGDTLQNGKYKIVRKLGWGESCTVWLAIVCKFV
jgi:hypothetical protein